jgi:antitoxin (DNA-binding transcriptional repressor) of toxin-antitoxin stability system
MVQPAGQFRTVSVAEARARFSELLDAAEAGETVVITRRGEPIVDMSAHRRAKVGADLSWLREAAAAIPHSPTDSGDLLREMRDSDRY